MNYFLDKNHFGTKTILYLRDQHPLNFNTSDYEQSLFSLRHGLVSREKRTIELTKAKSRPAFKCDRLPKEIGCSQQLLYEAYMKFEHQIS